MQSVGAGHKTSVKGSGCCYSCTLDCSGHSPLHYTRTVRTYSASITASSSKSTHAGERMKQTGQNPSYSHAICAYVRTYWEQSVCTVHKVVTWAYCTSVPLGASSIVLHNCAVITPLNGCHRSIPLTLSNVVCHQQLTHHTHIRTYLTCSKGSIIRELAMYVYT